MRFTIPRKDLLDGLQTVGRIVSTHSSLPILKHVLIEVLEGGRLRLSGTDLELGVEISGPVTVLDPGRFTVPVKAFAELVAALPEAEVTLQEASNGTLVVTCRRGEYRIPGMPAEDFPPMPEVGAAVTFEIAEPLLKEMIRQTAIAASDDDTRPILTGILVAVEGEHLRLAATDTHRLALRAAPVGQASGDIAVIVPRRALVELQKILGDEPAALLHVQVDKNQILFRTERTTLFSRLIEGAFPKYERVIPKSHTRRLTIPTDDFQASIRRARIAARDAAAKDRVVLSTDSSLLGDLLVITADGETGQCREEIEVARQGDDITIAFNVKYLHDLLGILDCQGVFLEMTEPLSPALFRPVDGGDYLMVIMPMSVE